MVDPDPRGPGRSRGFSLIELVVVMAIVAVLAALAAPSYLEQMRKARRAEAEAVMLEVQQYLQRHYQARNSYAGADLARVGLDRSPHHAQTGQQAHDIELQLDDDGQGYAILARPVAGLPDARCGVLRLEADGRKSTSTDAGMACWR